MNINFHQLNRIITNIKTWKREVAELKAKNKALRKSNRELRKALLCKS